MTRLNNFILPISFLLIVLRTHAQTSPQTLNIIPPSPTAASLGKYGEIPVGTYTGVPEISIPIYNIKQGPLESLIALSYHAVGIKVEELASWVGLGWSLQSGGVITRSFRGLPDETLSYFSSENNPTNPNNAFVTAVANGDKDGESDMYNFSFGKFQGSFFYDNSGAIHTLPLNNIKIVKTTTGWRLTDIDGTDYLFNTPEYTHVVKYCHGGNVNSSPQIFNDYPTSWYLSLIVSADKVDSLQFEYDPFNTQFSLSPVQTRNQLIGGTGNCTGGDDICVSTNYINGQRLKRIKFRNGYVNFNANITREDLPTDKRLDFIEIFNADGTSQKKHHFHYSYFQSAASCNFPEDQRRLKLDSLTEESTSITTPPYAFTYNNQYLPCRSSMAVDAWGYYNGATSNTSLIPTYSYQLLDGGYAIYNGADRKVNTSYTKAGILNKITYPTGGATLFEYENNIIWKEGEYPNTISNGVLIVLNPPQQNYTADFTINLPPHSSNYQIGGAIATINIDNMVTYSGGGTSANVYLQKLDASGNVISVTVLENGEVTNYHIENGSYRLLVQLPFPISPNDLSLNPAFHVAIDWQEPDTSDSHFLVGGLRIKQISNIAANNEQINVRKFKYIDHDNHSTGSMLSSIKHQYNLHSIKAEVDPITGLPSAYQCDYAVRQEYTCLPLTQASGSHIGYQLVTATETGKGYSTFEYTTPATHPDILIEQFPFAPVISYGWRRGRLIKQCDYNEGQTLPIRVKRNVYNALSSNYYSLNTTAGYNQVSEFPGTTTPEKTVYGIYSEFEYLQATYDTLFEAANHNAYIATQSTYEYNLQGFQISKSTVVDSKGQETVSEYKYPNDYSNTAMQGNIATLKQKNILSPIVYESISQNGKLIGGIVSSYNVDGKPLEKYAFESSIPVTKPGFNSLNINPDANLFKLREQISYNAPEKRVNEVIQEDGIRVVYLWGYKSSLPVAKIVGSDYNTVIQFINQSIIDNPVNDQQLITEINKIRAGLAASNALITSYTYKPLIGISSQTDPRGHTTYYEYDKLGRLITVKDHNGKVLKTYDYQYQ